MNWRIRSRSLVPSMREPVSLLSAACRIGVGVGAYAILVRWASLRGGALGLVLAVLCAPVASVVIGTGLVAIFPALMRWSKERYWLQWQGRYFAFDNRQIRIEQDPEGTVWIVLADVVAVTDLRVTETEIERLGSFARKSIVEFGAMALSEGALVAILSRRNYPAVNRFRLWLERDVLQPLHRRVELSHENGANS